MTARLTKVERYEAKALAEELLAQLYLAHQVVQVLEAKFTISPSLARVITKEAEASLLRAPEVATSQRRAEHVARIEALYRKALKAGRFSTCERLLVQLGRIFGVESPQHIVHTGAVSIDSEFEGKSAQELEHFVEHGRWPTGAQPQAERQAGERDDPLKGLH